VRSRSGSRLLVLFIGAVGAFGLFFGGLAAAYFLFGEGIAMLWIAAAAVFLGAGLILSTSLRRATAARLCKHGIRAMARIVDSTETGAYSNQSPEVALRLAVQMPGRQSYSIEHREFISLLRLHRVTPGESLTVLVDPDDPTVMAIDWAASAQVAPRSGPS